ncbi:hypothetical protein BDQ17DRAFT_1372873 [Cyathus striatus]|nr:hypothetical protein BDQ17DRAFT_1372873 [Cyathus striatus]
MVSCSYDEIVDPFEDCTNSVTSVALIPYAQQMVPDLQNIGKLQLISAHLSNLLSLGGPSIYTSCYRNGWTTDKTGNLLFWVPDYLRSGLCDFETILIIGPHISCRLDLSKFHHGSYWICCITSSL